MLNVYSKCRGYSYQPFYFTLDDDYDDDDDNNNNNNIY